MNIMVDAYLDNNLGDDLMIRYFASYFYQHKIYLVESREHIRKTFYDIPNIYFYSEEDYKMNEYDFQLHVTIGGSMFILDDFKKLIRFRHRIKNSRKIKKRNIPSAVIGCNLGPFDKRNFGLKLAKFELKYKNLVTVRDRQSKELLLRGFKRKKIIIKLFPDIIFSKVLDKSIPKYGLGISVYRSANSEVNNIQIYQELATLADKFIKRSGEKVALFAFDSENENDLVAAHNIKEMIEEKNKVEIIPYLGNSNIFLDKFLSCKKIVGIRFHSSILALISGIPLYSLSYSNKTQNMMSDLHLSKYCSPLNNIKENSELIGNDIEDGNLAIIKDRDRYELNRLSLEHFIEIEKLINNIYEKDQ